MSCEQGVNRLSRLAGRLGAGLSQLASKRGFYAGLALGAAGVMGAGLVALARRGSRLRSKPEADAGRAGLIDPRQVPDLPARRQVTPLDPATVSAPCQACQSPAKTKPGPWYAINNRPYCQDCAPAAAQQAGVELLRPAGQPQVSQPVHGQTTMNDYLSPERRVETRLVPSRLGLDIGRQAPGRVVVEKGYVLLRPDGRDTGLALTPGLQTEPGELGETRLREDESQWWLTHIPSGRRITGRPYARLEQAHLLGNILAQMDWTRDETEFTAADYRRVRATIGYFDQSLAEASAPAASPGSEPVTLTAPGLADRPLKAGTGESLEGKLVADGYGGVSRVLADNGATLFLVDSLGKRYEISRREARRPTESDFELCRVAMSFDPAQQPQATCATCKRAARDTGAGEMWYKMGWQAFCEGCAAHYAANEGYIREEEIDAQLEPMLG